MTKKELLERIAVLERRVAELEARPQITYTPHFVPPSQPVYVPYISPTVPSYPTLPWIVTC